MAMMKSLPSFYQQLATVLILLSYVLVQAQSKLPLTVARGSTKTCLPVFNCEENHFVKECEKSGLKETCEPCPKGQVQPNLISSLDSEEDRKCFKPVKEHDCPDADTVHSRIPYNAVWCKKQCKCNTNKCYWGISCMCKRRGKPCKVNEELDITTGECKSCKNGKYKPTEGCGPCRFKTTEENDVPSLLYNLTVSPATIQASNPHVEHMKDNESVSISMILLGLVLVMLVVVGIICGCLLLKWKKLKQSPSQEVIDPEKGGMAQQQNEGGQEKPQGNENAPLLIDNQEQNDEKTPVQATLPENDIPNPDDDLADVSKNPVQPESDDCDAPVSPSYRDIHGRENSANDSASMIIVNGPSIPPEPSENEEDTLLKSSSSFM